MGGTTDRVGSSSSGGAPRAHRVGSRGGSMPARATVTRERDGRRLVVDIARLLFGFYF